MIIFYFTCNSWTRINCQTISLMVKLVPVLDFLDILIHHRASYTDWLLIVSCQMLIIATIPWKQEDIYIPVSLATKTHVYFIATCNMIFNSTTLLAILLSKIILYLVSLNIHFLVRTKEKSGHYLQTTCHWKPLFV